MRNQIFSLPFSSGELVKRIIHPREMNYCCSNHSRVSCNICLIWSWRLTIRSRFSLRLINTSVLSCNPIYGKNHLHRVRKYLSSTLSLLRSWAILSPIRSPWVFLSVSWIRPSSRENSVSMSMFQSLRMAWSTASAFCHFVHASARLSRMICWFRSSFAKFLCSDIFI